MLLRTHQFSNKLIEVSEQAGIKSDKNQFLTEKTIFALKKNKGKTLSKNIR